MRFYLYHKSYVTGGTVLVAHPRGFPPTEQRDSWEPATPEQIEMLLPLACKMGRHIRIFALDGTLLEETAI